jgi:hypothetical protein
VSSSLQDIVASLRAARAPLPTSPNTAPVAAAAPDSIAGNINLNQRPIVHNPDGSFSTVRSMSFEENGQQVLVPTIDPQGKQMNVQESIDLYHRTGQHLGKFATEAQADSASAAISARQDRHFGQQPVLPVPPTDTSPDYKTAQTQDLLRSMGYDDVTIQRVAPGAVPPATTGPAASVDTSGAGIEAAKIGVQNNLTPTDTGKLQSYLRAVGDKTVNGLAELRHTWNNVAESVGEKASSALAQGSTNLTLGMAMLDVVSRLDNKVKIALAPEEQRHELENRYLPKTTLEDPRIKKEFGTATEAALWIQAQRVWGGANALAALPVQAASKLLGQMGMEEAAAAAGDIAARDTATAKGVESQAYGQLPQLVAGMAPMLSYQDVLESRFDPSTLEDTYKYFQDHGRYGQIAMGAIAVGGAVADVFAAPTAVIGTIPTKVFGMVPRLTRLLAPAKAAQITEEIAQRTKRFDDAARAAEAAAKYSAKTQSALDAEVAEKGTASPVSYRKMVLAKAAEVRNKLWLDQFADPGRYEPIMLRTARRNAKFYPEDTNTSYEFRKNAVGVQTPKSTDELTLDKRIARANAVEAGADYPIDWHDTENMPIGLKEQRILLGASDGEVAGDAINMLVKGAEIDDVAHMTLAPEYHVLPDVQSSLVSMRKVETANAAVPPRPENPLQIGITTRGLIEHHFQLAQSDLAAAKVAGDKGAIEDARATLRRVKDARSKLGIAADEPIDTDWLPKDGPGIMQDPSRFNNWLNVAGDRVIRSLHPDGLNLHFWTTKLGQGMSVAREPQRYYSAYAPDAWERIRSSYMRYDQNLRSANNMVAREMDNAGILEKRGAFDPAKLFSPISINKIADGQLFELLDQPQNTPKFDEAYQLASEPMQRAHDRIRGIMDHFADLQGVSGTDRYLSGYIRHVFDMSQFTGGARPLEYIGLPANAEVFASHLLERHGMNAKEKSAVLALDLYTRAANRKVILEPMYQDIVDTGAELAQKMGNTVHQTYANDLVSQLKGTPTFLGAKVDEWLGSTWNGGGGVKVPFMDKKIVYRPGFIDRKLMGLTSLVHTGLLTASPTYPMIQIASGLTTTVGRYGMFRTTRGLWLMGTKEGQQLAKVTGTYRPFIDIFESPDMRKYTELFSKIPANEWAERVSRGITFNAAVDEHMSSMGFKTWKQAVDAGFGKRILFEALRSSEEVNHMYGPLGRSPWLTRFMGTAGSSAATQFMSFIPKQSEELMSQAHRNPGRILQYMAVSGEIARQAANSGMDMTRYLGLGYLPQNLNDMTSPAVDAALSNLDLMHALTDNNPDQVQRGVQALTRSLSMLFPASQFFFAASKAVERLKTGAVTSPSGQKIYSMQMDKKPGEGLGGELIPTLLMQPNIRETLTRRAIQANTQENLRFAHNAHVAVDRFVDATEAGDTQGAAKLADELSNAYNIRFTGTTPIEQAMEARSISQVLRSMQGNPQLEDVYIENFRKHGVEVKP